MSVDLYSEYTYHRRYVNHLSLKYYKCIVFIKNPELLLPIQLALFRIQFLQNKIQKDGKYNQCILVHYMYIAYTVKNFFTATSTTGQIFLLALVSEISVLSSIISMLFCLLDEVAALPKLDLLVSIGVTLMYRSLFLCLFFQIWRELIDSP